MLVVLQIFQAPLKCTTSVLKKVEFICHTYVFCVMTDDDVILSENRKRCNVV